MPSTITTIVCLITGIIGLLVTILFWVPGIIDRDRLKEVLGKRYSLVYFVYFANGPLLVLFSLLLYLVSRISS